MQHVSGNESCAQYRRYVCCSCFYFISKRGHRLRAKKINSAKYKDDGRDADNSVLRNSRRLGFESLLAGNEF